MNQYDYLYDYGPPVYDYNRHKFAAVTSGGERFEWDGITKLMEFDGLSNGVPNVIGIHHDQGKAFIKVAADFPAAVRAKIAALEYDPKGLWVVSNAMGTMETWGANRNGDAFPKMGLANADERYGHKTFEKYAHPYLHHMNKDPKNSVGEKVAFSHYDDEMEKVILLYKLSRDKAGDLCERLDKGEAVATSMGCKVPFDVCSICDHKAKTAAEYCDHCKYYPGQMMPNGQKVAMINIFPRFFDQSHVLRGADKIAYAWDVDPGKRHKKAYYIPSAWKALEEPGYLDFANGVFKAAHDRTIKSSDDKTSTITKEIPADMGKAQPEGQDDGLKEISKGMEPMEENEQTLTLAQMTELLGGISPQAVMGTAAHHGAVLTPEEFQRLSMTAGGEGDKAQALDKASVSIRELPDVPVVLHKNATCRNVPNTDDWVIRCTKCAAEVHDPVDMAQVPDMWSLSPETIDAVLSWLSPDDFAAYHVNMPDEMMRSGLLEDVSQWKMNRESERVLGGFFEKRSAWTANLYHRMLDKLAEHATEPQVHDAHDGSGPVKIIIIEKGGGPNGEHQGMGMGMGGLMSLLTGGGAAAGGASPGNSSLPSLLASRILYALYRSAMSGMVAGPNQLHPNGPTKMSSIFPMAKTGFEWARGVPTKAYVKYAYRWKHPSLKGRIQPGSASKKASLVCDTFLLNDFIAEPLTSHDKRASVVAFAADELIDAATLIGLSYARGLE